MDLEAWGHIWSQMVGLWSIGWAQHSQALMRPRERDGWNPCALPHQGTQTESEKGKGQYSAWSTSFQVSRSFIQTSPPISPWCVKGLGEVTDTFSTQTDKRQGHSDPRARSLALWISAEEEAGLNGRWVESGEKVKALCGKGQETKVVLSLWEGMGGERGKSIHLLLCPWPQARS